MSLSREMGHVVPAQEDVSGLFHKIHDVPGFNVGVLSSIWQTPQTLRLEWTFLGTDTSQVSL